MTQIEILSTLIEEGQLRLLSIERHLSANKKFFPHAQAYQKNLKTAVEEARKWLAELDV